MRKLFIILSIMVTSLTLVGCTGNDTNQTPPSYTGVRVENTNPLDGNEFVTFYSAKQDTLLVEVGLSNPDNLDIKSVVINGITYQSHRFLEDSTSDTIYFEMSVGTVLGETIYSVDRVNYLDGENTKSVEGFTNNEFKAYVYKESPTVERENYNLTRDSISIDFNINDNDSVISPGTLKALLYAGETLITEQVLTSGLTTVDFTGLLANKHYEVKVVATYDLDDNNGILNNVVLYSGTYSTLANGLPSASVKDVDVSSNSVDFSVEFTDDDEVVVPAGLSVVIFNGDVQLTDPEYTINIVGSTIGLSFEDLLNDNTYTIKVIADYDLNDGSGVITNNVLAVHTFSTLPREVPQPKLTDLNLLENSIEFDVFIDDPDGIIDQETIIANLYIEDVFIDTANVEDYHVDFQVNNLFANHSFKIELVANYDLNNGLGVQEDEIIYSEVFSTLENAVPSVTVTSIDVEQGYLTVTLDVIDNNSTLLGSLEAVLYEEGTEVQTINFDITKHELIFDYATKAGVSYYVEIFADYNLRDGSGALYDQSLRRIVSFTAEAKAPIAEIQNVTTDVDSITFDVEVIDADLTIQTGSVWVYIYHEGNLIDDFQIATGMSTVTFNNLLSNNEYEIIIEADYDLDDGSGVLQDQNLTTHAVSTEVKEVPTATIENPESTITEIIIDVDIVDNDSVIETGTIRADLIHEGSVVDTETLGTGGNFGVTFDTLLSDNNYEIKIYVDYDLDDGNGIKEDEILAELSISTKAKAAPTAEFRYSAATETEIVVDVYVTDDDNVILPGLGTLQAVLILDDVPAAGVDPIDLSVGLNTDITFENLYSNERYYVDIVVDYSLNDGEADIIGDVIVSDYIRTVGLEEVNAFISSISATIDTVTIDVEVIDLGGVINGDLQAVIYQNDVEVDAIDINVGNNDDVTFTLLDSETEYFVRIEADYNLNEASGPVVAGLLDESNITTLALSAPTAVINEFTEGFESFTVDITIDNSDNTITGNRVAVLYKDGIEVVPQQAQPLTDGFNNDVLFTNLLSDSTYTVKIFVDYDLHDGAGVHVASELTDDDVTTLAKSVPEVDISNLGITTDEVTFNFVLDDVNEVMEPGFLLAELYDDQNQLVASKTIFTDEVSFGISGFLADYDFEIRIYGDYNLDNGSGVQVGGEIDRLQFKTISYDAPTAVIQTVVVNQNTVNATIDVSDLDGTITGNLVARLYDNDDDYTVDAPIEEITLEANGNMIAFSEHLEYGKFYSVVVFADYNLLDGEGTVTEAILAEYVVSVYNKLLPQADVSNLVITQETITFDVDVYDNDAVIELGTVFAEIYLDGVKVDDQEIFTGANPGIQFGGTTPLFSNRDYEIRIVTSYDNDNGNLVQSGYIMSSQVETTEAKKTPEATILSDLIEATRLTFDIIVDDDDSVIDNVYAILYDDDDQQVESIEIFEGDNIDILFSGLLGSTNYNLEIEAHYNLDDDLGDRVTVISQVDQATPTSNEPEALIQGLYSTTSTVTAIFDFIDYDNVSTNNYLRIYDGETLVDTITIAAPGVSQTETFTQLTPNKSYRVAIESTYDLNDLDGVHTDELLFDDVIATDSLIIIDTDLQTVDKKSNTLAVEVNDPESLITSATISVELIQADGNPVDDFSAEIVDYTALTYIDLLDLLSDNDYDLEFTATYNVGAGNVTEVIYTHEFTTHPLEQPIVTISNAVLWTQNALTVAVNITEDVDDVANDTEWFALLYQDGTLLGASTVDIDGIAGNPENGATDVTFTGIDLLDGSTYTIVVTADLDLNILDQLDPGSGDVTTVMTSRTVIYAEN